MSCPFCKCDPFHRGDHGEALAVNCCDAGYALYSGEKKAKQALRFIQSPSPRKKARANRILAEFYC